MRASFGLVVAGLLSGASMAAAQSPEPEPDAPAAGAADEDEGDYEEIVVTGAPLPGSVGGSIKPEQELSAADVRSYGVSSVAELLAELSPQTDGRASNPVVLLNGKRISGFSEIADIPTEAIARVEILPEDVSLRFGYPPNQKVTNIVLRPRFRSMSGEVRAGTTTDGGRESGTAIATMLRIRGDNRVNLSAEYARADDLRESERGIDPTPPRQPFAIPGTITSAVPGSEIDPALSALAGAPVTRAAVPTGFAGAVPALADFVPGANGAAVTDTGRFRTLSPATESLTLSGVMARSLGGVSATVSARLQLSDRDSLQGLPTASLLIPDANPFSPFAGPAQLYAYLPDVGALRQSVESTNARLGLGLNGALGTWRWTFTGSYDLTVTRTATDRGVDAGAVQSAIAAGDPALNPFAALPAAALGARLVDTGRSRISALSGDLLLSGPLFKLPAGQATASVRAGGSTSDFDGRSLRSGVAQRIERGRDIADGQLSIDLPIASRRAGVLAGIGDLSVNANAATRHLSDFGTLSTFGYGLRWTPVPELRLLASVSQDRAAPTGQQISDPTVVTPNAPIFDYSAGRTVFVSQLGGGNPGLRASDRRTTRLSATLKPLPKPDLTITATYTNSRTDDPIAAFPVPTPAIEAAFPQRFLRGADGALVQLDARPINYDRAQSETLRWGVNLSVPLKTAMQRRLEELRASGASPEDIRALFRRDRLSGQAEGGERPQRGPGEGGRGGGDGARAGGFGPGGGGGGGRGRFGGGGGGGRLQFALFHTWHLRETVRIAPGLPVLDLLDGDVAGAGGGQPRHELQAQAGYSNNGLGARLSANWQSATRVDGGAGTLRFSSLATADLRLFADFGQMRDLTRRHPFLRGARATLSVTNLFNQRQEVRDGTGATPLRYQPGYLDPLGRTVTLSLRKRF